MNNNFETGKIGECIACDYLVKKGWIIIKKNHRERSDEIDIIALSDDGILVFCEVKAMLKKEVFSGEGLMPEDNLTSAKLRKISRACQLFAGKNQNLIDLEKGWRIDLIAVDLGANGKAQALRHYENI
jgi:putative endonuclease